jgi:hypothetical protein
VRCGFGSPYRRSHCLRVVAGTDVRFSTSPAVNIGVSRDGVVIGFKVAEVMLMADLLNQGAFGFVRFNSEFVQGLYNLGIKIERTHQKVKGFKDVIQISHQRQAFSRFSILEYLR